MATSLADITKTARNTALESFLDFAGDIIANKLLPYATRGEGTASFSYDCEGSGIREGIFTYIRIHPKIANVKVTVEVESRAKIAVRFTWL